MNDFMNKTNDNLGMYILQLDQNQSLTRDIYSEYDKFNYELSNVFKTDVDFLVKAYDLQLTEAKNIRSEQDNFRQKLINRDKVCVISKTDYDDCEAAHIIPLAESNNYDIDNGLLLDRTLHSSFDKHYWCIHPHTLRVILNETKIKQRNLTCVKYRDLLVNIQPNKTILENLQKRYEMFMCEFY
jgi:hypothetical protein